MATPPVDRSVLSAEADARELDTPSADDDLLAGRVEHSVIETRDRQNFVALEEETRRRLEVESTLRDSEARYRLLYDNNPTMYFTLSPDGTVVSVNQFGATQLGYQPDELIGQSILKVFKPEEHHAVLGQLTVCAASPMKVFQWEIQKVRKDGSTLWVKERAQAVMDHRGQILALVVCEDITERRVTEDCMRESEERWRALFEHAGVGMAQLSVSGQFLRVNPRLCETLGYSSKTMLRCSCPDFIHPEDFEVHQAHLKELLGGKHPAFSMEARCRRSDDVWVWVDMTVSLVRDATTAPAYFIAVVQNITDRKRAEEALQKSEARFRQIAETIQEVVWSADPKISRMLYISPAYERVWGRTCSSLYDDPKSFIDSIHPDDRERVVAGLAEHQLGLPFVQEYRIRRPDGTVRWVWDRGFPVRDSNTGDLTHYVGVALDITDRRQAEEALRASESSIRELHEITSGKGVPFDLQIRELLDLGRRRFQLPTGIFTTFKGDELGVTAVRSDKPVLEEGTLLPLCHICGETLTMNHSVAIEHVEPSRWGEGSVCPLLKFRSYLGTSLSADGQRFGTICFVDYEPYHGRFSEADKDFLLLMARWISRELERQNSELTLQNQEEALRASEERFSKAFRSSPYPIGITDLETGICLDINDAALSAFGYRREEVIGQTTSLLGIWSHPKERKQFIQRIKSNGNIRNLEVALNTKYGEVRRFLASTEVIVLNGKECLVTIGTDITEQKRAEEALRRSELAVRQAFEERERLSQDLHDNLLQSLYAVGMGLELTKQRIQRTSRTNAKRLEQSVGQLNHVIREVRSFISHVQSPFFQDQTVGDLLRALASSFTATGAGEIIVVVEDEAGAGLSLEQRTHLLAIAKEALSNSIRHTKAEKRTLSLRRRGNKIRLEISDNGHGFSPAQRRAQGMGLQNMRARARKLRGRIAITSVLGQGTTVTLTIPSA